MSGKVADDTGLRSATNQRREFSVSEPHLSNKVQPSARSARWVRPRSIPGNCAVAASSQADGQ